LLLATTTYIQRRKTKEEVPGKIKATIPRSSIDLARIGIGENKQTRESAGGW